MAHAATPPTDHDDDLLVADLRRLLAALDPVPADLGLAARLAIEWRTLEAELAALVHDSDVDEPAFAVRGGAGPRVLTFEAEDLTIEIEAQPRDDAVSVVGQLVPPQPAQIAVHSGGRVVAARADERGRFEAAGLSRGPLRLRCRLHDARLVETATLTI